MKKRSLAAGLALALSLSLTPIQAANTTYLDVDHTVWYSTPIAFCQQHQLMDGPSPGQSWPRPSTGWRAPPPWRSPTSCPLPT